MRLRLVSALVATVAAIDLGAVAQVANEAPIAPVDLARKLATDKKVGVFSRICGFLLVLGTEPTCGRERFLGNDTSEIRTPFWWSVSLCC